MKHWLTLLLGLFPVMAASQTLRFGHDRVQVWLPDAMQTRLVASDDGSETLLATLGSPAEYELALSLVLDADADTPADTGEAFVRHLAQQQGGQPQAAPGRVVLTTPGADLHRDGGTYRTLHWAIGFGRNAVTMTLTAPDSDVMSPALDAFFAQTLNRIVRSLQAVPR